MNRKIYLDYCRVLACISVVVLHVSALWNQLPATEYKCIVSNIYILFNLYPVAVFVMISGALYLDPKKEVNTKKFWTKTICRFVCIYIVWQMFYVIVEGNQLNNLKDIVKNMMKPYYILWYLPMQIGLYAVTPLLRKIASDKRVLGYWIALAGIVNLIGEFINKVYSGGVLNSFMDGFMVEMVGGWTFYFVLGYFLDTVEIKCSYRRAIYLGTLFLLILTIFDRLQNGGKGTHITFIYLYGSNFSIVRVMLVLSVFLGLKYCCWKVGNSKVIKKLSSLTLGVYLLHIFVIERVYTFGSNWIESIDPIWMIPIISIFTVTVCFFLTWILKRIPILGKYLI